MSKYCSTLTIPSLTVFHIHLLPSPGSGNATPHVWPAGGSTPLMDSSISAVPFEAVLHSSGGEIQPDCSLQRGFVVIVCTNESHLPAAQLLCARAPGRSSTPWADQLRQQGETQKCRSLLLVNRTSNLERQSLPCVTLKGLEPQAAKCPLEPKGTLVPCPWAESSGGGPASQWVVIIAEGKQSPWQQFPSPTFSPPPALTPALLR